MHRKLPIPLILLALLLGAAGAQAGSADPVATPIAFEEPAELEEESEGEEGEEESAEEECEDGGEEFEEGEISQEEFDEACERQRKRSGPLQGECSLRSIHGHAAVDANGEKLNLTIGYTAYKPATAKVEIGRGASVQRHLGRSGVLRLVERLRGDSVPKQLVVRFRILSAESAGCPSRRLVLFPK